LQSPFMKWAAYAAFFIWFGYQLIEMFGLTQVKAHLWYWPHAILFLLFMVILCGSSLNRVGDSLTGTPARRS